MVCKAAHVLACRLLALSSRHLPEFRPLARWLAPKSRKCHGAERGLGIRSDPSPRLTAEAARPGRTPRRGSALPPGKGSKPWRLFRVTFYHRIEWRAPQNRPGPKRRAREDSDL